MTAIGKPAQSGLDGLLAALPVALAVYDAEHRLLLVSDAVLAWHGLDPGLAPPGTRFVDLVRILAWAGAYGSGEPEALARAVIAIDRSRPSTRLVRSRNERIAQMESRPLPGGGFFTCAMDITILSRSGAEAEARVRQLETVLSRLHGGVALYDSAMRIRLMNPAYERLMGLPGGTLRPGMTHREALAVLEARGEIDAEEHARIAARMESQREQEVTRYRQRNTGEALRFDSQPMPDSGMLVEVDDITALKRAEEEAQRRAALLDGVLEALPHGVCVYGPDRRLARVNAAYARIMAGAAVAPGDLLEDIVARRIAAGEFTAAWGELSLQRRLLPADAPVPTRRLRPNGTVIEVSTARLPDGGHISVVTDVTALHRAETEARQHATMLEGMLAIIDHGVIMYGPDRRVIVSNARTAELTGIPQEELRPGALMDELIQRQVARGEIAPAAAQQVTLLDRRRPHRYSRPRPDGRVLAIASDPTPDGGFVLSYTDVTDDRRIRAELEQARAAAEAASAAKSRFLATMSHELRTPLNAVIGFSEALASERDAGRIRDYAQAINQAGRHLLLLIDDILDVARSQTGALDIAAAPVALAPLLEAAAREMAGPARDARLTLSLALPPVLPALQGDARRLRQVLLNLLSNAVKFTPAGGRVSLSAEVTAEGLAIRVADTGIGIAAADRERVFEPFTQLDSSLSRRFQGSGLGLHLVRMLVTALGGSVALEDPPGPGTLVVLRFPAARLVAPAPPPA